MCFLVILLILGELMRADFYSPQFLLETLETNVTAPASQTRKLDQHSLVMHPKFDGVQQISPLSPQHD